MGNDFIYKDNFTQSREEYEEELDMFDEEGNRLFQKHRNQRRFHPIGVRWYILVYNLALQLASTDDGGYLYFDWW